MKKENLFISSRNIRRCICFCSCFFWFNSRQLTREDKKRACDELCKLATSQLCIAATGSVSSQTCPRRLKVVSTRASGTETIAFVDCGGIPNVMRTDMGARLLLVPRPTSTKKARANGQQATCHGALGNVSVRLEGSVTNLNFLVVNRSPVDFLAYICANARTRISRDCLGLHLSGLVCSSIGAFVLV